MWSRAGTMAAIRSTSATRTKSLRIRSSRPSAAGLSRHGLADGDNLETVSSVSASDLPGGLYLNIEYSCGQDLCPDRLPVRIVNYFEGDGFDFNPKYYEDEELILQSDYRSRLLTRVTSDGPVYEENFWLGSYSVRGPLGHYWVGDQKIAEVAYEIGP